MLLGLMSRWMTCHRQDQCPGEIGGRVGQHVRSIRDYNALGCRGGEVDVVVPHGIVGEDLQSGCGGQQGRIDAIGQGADGRVRVVESCVEGLPRRRDVAWLVQELELLAGGRHDRIGQQPGDIERGT